MALASVIALSSCRSSNTAALQPVAVQPVAGQSLASQPVSQSVVRSSLEPVGDVSAQPVPPTAYVPSGSPLQQEISEDMNDEEARQMAAQAIRHNACIQQRRDAVGTLDTATTAC